jgi:hypothetical protein
MRSAIQTLRPLSLNPRLKAKPPPNKKQISQGNLVQTNVLQLLQLGTQKRERVQVSTLQCCSSP